MSLKDESLAHSHIDRAYNEFLFPAATFFEEPLRLVRGEGMYVWDDSGKRYLDCFAGGLAITLGHANQAVNKAIIEQVKTIQHTSTFYANKPQSDLAERLAQITPGRLKRSFFTNSGPEANDTAMVAAKAYTKHQVIIVLRHSYYGPRNPASPESKYSRPLPSQISDIVHARTPYCYRCPYKLTYPECGLACANDIEDQARSMGGEIAAFMAEPILVLEGVIVPPPGYFERAAEIARKYDGVFIADEAHTAWGRTGDKWFGIEHWNVEPDIITSSGGMGNVIPIGMTTATPEVADSYPGLTLSTFGGNPVATATALAVIRLIEEEGLRQNAALIGMYLNERLEELKSKYSIIGDVRGLGLLQALELVKDRETKEPHSQAAAKIIEEIRRRGVMMGKGGIYGNVLHIGMPLIATRDHVDELVHALDASLQLILMTL